MMRRIAVVGDKLDNDGEVCPYEGPQFLADSTGRCNDLVKSLSWCIEV